MGLVNEEDFVDIGFRRKSEDKLNYRNIVADAINWCRKAQGTIYFHKAVEGLEKVIWFDIPGYKLKSKTLKIQYELRLERTKKLNFFKQKYGRQIYRRKNRMQVRLYLEDWYWNEYFSSLIQLLASENLLFETEKVIPLRIGQTSEDTEQIL